MEGDQNIPPQNPVPVVVPTDKSKGTSAPAARNARHRSAVQPAAPSSRGASANARPPRNAPTRSTRPVVACRGASVAPVRTARPPAVPTTRNVASRAVSQLSAATARVQHHPPKPTLAAVKTAHYMSSTIPAAAHSIKPAIARPAVPAVPVAAPNRTVRVNTKSTVVASKPKPAPTAAPRFAIRPVNRPSKPAGPSQVSTGNTGPNPQAVAPAAAQHTSQPGVPLVQRGTKTPAAESTSSHSDQQVVVGNEVSSLGQQAALTEESDQPSSTSDVSLPPLVDINAIGSSPFPLRAGRESFVPDRPRNEQIQYFRDLIGRTTAYLTGKADQWEQVLNKPSKMVTVSEEGVELIRLATGQSRLFMAKKLQQFVGLVDDCEFLRGNRETSPLDLAGFWDMIKMQVLGIREKFDQIEALAGNKWVALPSSSVSVPAAGKPKNAAKKSVLKAVDGNLKPKTSINSTGAHLKSVRELMKQKRRELSAGSAAVNHEDETGVDGLAAGVSEEGLATSSPVEPETVYAGGDETVLVIEQELAVTQIEIRSESVLA